MTKPRVTVLMGVFNGERFLREAVDSILAQTFRDFELLVVDDGSTDGTSAILESYRDDRLCVIRNTTNAGLTRSLNIGLRAARGELVARQDADDRSHPHRLASQIAYLDTHPDVAVVGSEVRLINEHGRRVRTRSWVRCTEGVAVRWQLMFESPFAHSAVIFRRAVVWDELGGYDETYRTSQDFELWSRVARRWALANLPQQLIDFRSHPHSVSKTYVVEGVEKVRVTLRANMRYILGDGDYERWLAFWVTVNNVRTYGGQILNLSCFLDDFDALQERFASRYGEHAEVRAHAAAMLTRVSGTVLREDRRVGVAAYAAALRTHPATALRGLPAFAAKLLLALLRGSAVADIKASTQ